MGKFTYNDDILEANFADAWRLSVVCAYEMYCSLSVQQVNGKATVGVWTALPMTHY